MKKQVMTSIDNSLHEKAKDLRLNVSQVLEDAIRDRANSKKNLPESSIHVKCTQCQKVIEEGYYCRENEMVLCTTCQENYKMHKRCKPAYEEIGGQLIHEHIHWPGYEGQNAALKESICRI